MKRTRPARLHWPARIWGTTIEIVQHYPALALTWVFMAGILAWGAFNWSLELANTETFCISCHEMKDNLYEDFKKTIHYTNRTGIRATCPDCHVPKEWSHKVVRKVKATNELFHWFAGSIDSREKFVARRPQLAQHVWDLMEASDSRECRNCHSMEVMNQDSQTAPARVMHELATRWSVTCIKCHAGIAHALPDDFDNTAFMDEIHDRMEAEKINCRLCHEDMAGPPPGEDWN